MDLLTKHNIWSHIKKYTPLFIILGITIIFLWKLVFTDLILAKGDTLHYIYPYWEHRSRTLLNGEIPLWNPYIFMGTPFLANPQSGVLYPLNWIILPFSVTDAAKISIVSHILIASLGTYKLAIRSLKITQASAIVSAITFALGGHISAKIEQINQLQGLAWLPWILLINHYLIYSLDNRKKLIRYILILSLLIAVQLLSGHTQSCFISLIGVLIWSSALLRKYIQEHTQINRTYKKYSYIYIFLSIATCYTIAVLLTAAQLLPTLELSQLSLRNEGLNLIDSLSFSINPQILGRVLLPSLTTPIFSEYVGYIGIIGICLVILAIHSEFTKKTTNSLLAPISIMMIGILFSLGAYNPLYWLLAKFIPGFDLFRAPSRWLVLWSIGSSLITGYGLDIFIKSLPNKSTRTQFITLISIFLLILLYYLSTNYTPAGETGPLPPPSTTDLTFWLSTITLYLIIAVTPLLPIKTKSYLIMTLLIFELILSSRSLPLNKLTTPESYYSIRPPMTTVLSKTNTNNPTRLFSYSTLLYDPGDLKDLKHRYSQTLSEESTNIAINASKSKSVFSPNLSQSWKLPSLDGYDGGILPTRAYAQFFSQFTPDGKIPVDGRLRERIDNMPENWLLNITNTKWIITDKLSDIWRNNVYYDTSNVLTLSPFESTTIYAPYKYQTNVFGLIMEASDSYNNQIGQVNLTLDNNKTISLAIPPEFAREGGQLQLNEPSYINTIEIKSLNNTIHLTAVSLIDNRSKTFNNLVIGPYKLIHSGDVKIYENLTAFGHAFMVDTVPLNSKTVTSGSASIEYKNDHKIMIKTENQKASTLILSQSAYPGWHVTVDNVPKPIGTANDLFPAIKLDPGNHTIVFEYNPRSWLIGWITSAVSLVLVIVFIIIHREDANPANSTA